MGGASGNQGGSGNSKSEMKKKAEKDTQVSAYEKEINKQNAAKEKTKTNTPKDNDRDNQKVIVPSKKPADYDIEKDDTGVKKSIEDAKKTPIVIPKDNDGGSGTVVKPIVAQKPTPPPATIVTPPPTKAEVDQGTSTMMSDAEISVKNKKKGRSPTILTGAAGLGNSSVRTTKRTLGA
tara:strand:+ start:132 stop:665 length:534 start_codon:yes stop_codon:yes gene_type:complete